MGLHLQQGIASVVHSRYPTMSKAFSIASGSPNEVNKSHCRPQSSLGRLETMISQAGAANRSEANWSQAFTRQLALELPTFPSFDVQIIGVWLNCTSRSNDKDLCRPFA